MHKQKDSILFHSWLVYITTKFEFRFLLQNFTNTKYFCPVIIVTIVYKRFQITCAIVCCFPINKNDTIIFIAIISYKELSIIHFVHMSGRRNSVHNQKYEKFYAILQGILKQEKFKEFSTSGSTRSSTLPLWRLQLNCHYLNVWCAPCT